MDVTVGLWKKGEHRRIDAFGLWCWRLLRVFWTARRSNQSILKIIPGCSLEGLMLKLKLEYFGYLMQRVDSLENTLMLGRIGGRRRRGRQRMRWLDGITNSMDMSLSNSRSWWWTGRPGMLRFMGLQRVGHDWVSELIWGFLDHMATVVLVFWGTSIVFSIVSTPIYIFTNSVRGLVPFSLHPFQHFFFRVCRLFHIYICMHTHIYIILFIYGCARSLLLHGFS